MTARSRGERPMRVIFIVYLAVILVGLAYFFTLGVINR